jgi:hypothetical protein
MRSATAAILGLAMWTACGGAPSSSLEDNGGSPDGADSPSAAADSGVDGAAGSDAADDVTARSDSAAADSPSGPIEAQPEGADDSAVADTGTEPDAPGSSDASGQADARASGDASGSSDAAGSTDARSEAGVGCSPGCGPDKVCAYLVADACSAVGTCVTPPTPSMCDAIVLESACGCDGSTVHWDGGCKPDLPDGYAPAPVVHSGACP